MVTLEIAPAILSVPESRERHPRVVRGHGLTAHGDARLHLARTGGGEDDRADRGAEADVHGDRHGQVRVVGAEAPAEAHREDRTVGVTTVVEVDDEVLVGGVTLRGVRAEDRGVLGDGEVRLRAATTLDLDRRLGNLRGGADEVGEAHVVREVGLVLVEAEGNGRHTVRTRGRGRRDHDLGTGRPVVRELEDPARGLAHGGGHRGSLDDDRSRRVLRPDLRSDAGCEGQVPCIHRSASRLLTGCQPQPEQRCARDEEGPEHGDQASKPGTHIHGVSFEEMCRPGCPRTEVSMCRSAGGCEGCVTERGPTIPERRDITGFLAAIN